MAKAHICGYCQSGFPTLRGLRSHLSQAQRCKAREEAAVAARIQNPNTQPTNQVDEDMLSEVTTASTFGESISLSPHQAMGVPEPETGDKRARVDEIDDDSMNDPISTYNPQYHYVQNYPGPAGTPLRACKLPFEEHREAQAAAGLQPWSPFQSEEEWELARWLMESGASQGKIDQFLKLKKIRKDVKPAFKNKRTFLKYIDSLPHGPNFICTPMKIVGDLKDSHGAFQTETLELWHRDPLECVAEILANPQFNGHQAYRPQRTFRNQKNGTPFNREYSEMWTANWWWEIQGKLPEGATIAPIIIASDETQLSNFCGDKKAWPVYLTIGNIAKAERRKPSSRAWVLLGYIPISKLDCYSKDKRSSIGCQLFHDCMRKILEPLLRKELAPTEMRCADGFSRHVYGILAAYVADYPEQCRIACCRENSCPKCTVLPKERGEPGPLNSVYRDPEETLDLLAKQSNGWKPPGFVNQNLRLVNPFWKDLPHCNIFECITPDLLHQLHKGVFSDHVSSWATKTVDGGEAEIDARYRSMTTHPTLRHFKKGISGVSQWTGGEYRSMAKVFLSTLAGAADPGVIRAVRALEDFMYYAHFETHCDESLEAMHIAWETFHHEKSIFCDLEVRQHFNISKLHNVKHYVESICSRGTTDNFNSEISERLHIDLAKAGYRASNRRNFMVQMTIWLTRQEAIQRFTSYLEWAVKDYIAEDMGDGDDIDEEDEGEDEDNDENDNSDEGKKQEETTYTVAKKPSSHVTVDVIQKEYTDEWFLWYLNKFIDDNSLIPNMDADCTENTIIPIYKQARIHLPFLSEAASERSIDVVHASKAEPAGFTARGVKAEQPAKTSTVLIRVAEKDDQKGPLYGLQAAHVLLIFQLPPSIGSYLHPLVFVHFFKPFNRAPVSDLNLLETSYAYRQHAKHGAIIPLTHIVQTCHLTPHFDRVANRDWTSANILNVAPSFYLNPYLRHRDFHLLRFQVYVYQKKQIEREREFQRKRARRIH